MSSVPLRERRRRFDDALSIKKTRLAVRLVQDTPFGSCAPVADHMAAEGYDHE